MGLISFVGSIGFISLVFSDYSPFLEVLLGYKIQLSTLSRTAVAKIIPCYRF
jgi:hypothetical protein